MTAASTPPSPPASGRGLLARTIRPALVWLRSGAIAFGWVVVLLGREAVGYELLVAATAVLVGFLLLRLVLRPTAAAELRAAITVEPVVAIAAVVLSGGWGSPFALYLGIPLLTVGMVLGFKGLGLAAGYVLVLSAQEVLDASPGSPSDIAQALVPIVIGTAAGMLGRWLLTSDVQEDPGSLGRVEQLTHVNALLATLHTLVRTSPAPLTVEDVLRVARDETREMFDVDSVVLLLADEGGRWWRPVTVEGVAVGRQIARSDLPAEVLADQSSDPVEIPRLPEGGGITPGARSGAYLWLFSRGRPAALLVLEHSEPRQLPEARLEVLQRMSAPLGLAVDNAVWFQRLRTLGAEEERQRIGATLHDRFAQSLAYVNMELERLATAHPDDPAVARLRDDVRDTLSDLRETLREIRLRCTEERGLVPTLAGHLERFGDRFGVMVDFDVTGDVRAPVSVENQLLRAAQDLLVLAQRESAATSISVVVATEPGRLRLVVRDDGRGVAEEEMGHEASRILALVRDRVDAVGGLVDVLVRPDEGTEVAVTVRGLR